MCWKDFTVKKDLTVGELLNVVAVLIAFFLSLVVAWFSVDWQSKSTEKLESTITFSQIILDLHDSLTECETSIASLSEAKFANSTIESKRSVMLCRAKISKMRAGLKVMKNELKFVRANQIYDNLSTFNERLLKVSEYINDSQNTFRDHITLTDQLSSLIDDPAENTIDLRSLKLEIE